MYFKNILLNTYMCVRIINIKASWDHLWACILNEPVSCSALKIIMAMGLCVQLVWHWTILKTQREIKLHGLSATLPCWYFSIYKLMLLFMLHQHCYFMKCCFTLLFVVYFWLQIERQIIFSQHRCSKHTAHHNSILCGVQIKNWTCFTKLVK